MIRVESITVTEFRGIRDLTLDFKGKNFAVCGPNGTGKSGVVDALEFALTGSVSRLTGEGRGEVSLKEHGPHVDVRTDPTKARVKVALSIPSRSKTCTVERTVKTPGVPIVTPDEPEVREVIRNLEQHPEIVLSRRELIKYVLATPGNRAKEVQTLLHLDQVEKVRAGLQKVANALKQGVLTRQATVEQEARDLRAALGVEELGASVVLTAVNRRRAELGLPPLGELTATSSLKDGMSSPPTSAAQTIHKGQTIVEIEAARRALADLASEQTASLIAEMQDSVKALASDPIAVAGLERDDFYKTGLSLIDSAACPLCDSEWEPAKLRERIGGKLKQLESFSTRRTDALAKLAPVVGLLRAAQTAFGVIINLAERTKTPPDVKAARAFVSLCGARERALSTLESLPDVASHLSTMSAIPIGVSEVVDALERVAQSLPEPTKLDGAREWLTVAQERLERYRKAQRELQTVQQQAETARKVSDTFQSTSDHVLSGIYSAVQDDLSAMYAFINRTDEDNFRASLKPSKGTLDLDVEFYGRGFFPPGAYHSEGHQDGMGLCLYLALMRHIHGANFTISILDDVLMSVDSGHRREVCALLKKEFPQTQFILTTHDPVWLKHMQTEELVDSRGAVRFGKWSVESGPGGFREGDVWVEISDALEKNDVRAAAALLRHHLEYESAELCHRLRAAVEFRGDHQYLLGELLPSAIGQLKKLYGEAKNSANSWNNKALVEEIGARSSAFTALVEASKAEQWQVNAAVHYNSWAMLETSDFEPVAKAYRDLLDGFRCSQCREFLRVSPPRESKESLRCGCGQAQLNLLPKKK